MLDFAYSTEATMNASPQAIFDIVSNPARHAELTGSRELNKITQQPVGPVGTGIHIVAEETVVMADGSSMPVSADSVVVTCDPPNSFSWITNPVFPETVRRVQWWFRMSPQGSGTKVIHEVEVDFGDLKDPMMKGLKDNYEQIRAGVVRTGMDKTLENLKKMAGG